MLPQALPLFDRREWHSNARALCVGFVCWQGTPLSLRVATVRLIPLSNRIGFVGGLLSGAVLDT